MASEEKFEAGFPGNITQTQQAILFRFMVGFINKTVAAKTKVNISGMSLKHREDGPLLVIRGTKGRKKMVAFISGDDFEGFCRATYKKVQSLDFDWREDKF